MPIQQRELNRLCPFCTNVPGDSAKAFVVQDDLVSAFMNPRQFEQGAMLVIPKEHRESIVDMQDDELAAIHTLSKRLVRATVEQLDAMGATIYQRNGVIAGQSVPHYHLHIIPRYADSDPDTEMFFSPNVEKAPYAERRRLADLIATGLTKTD